MQGMMDALRRYRKVGDAYANRIFDGVRYGGGDWKNAAFGEAFSAERSGTEPLFLKNRNEHSRNVLPARNAIDQWIAIQQQAVIENHVFEERLPNAHHCGALVLTAADERIDGFTCIAADDEPLNRHLTGAGVDGYRNRSPADFPKHARRLEGSPLVERCFLETVSREPE